MELRFAEGARATKDIDIGLTGDRQNGSGRLEVLSRSGSMNSLFK
jgi:hypothetical protein